MTSACEVRCASEDCDQPVVAHRTVWIRDARLALTPVQARYGLCGGHATFYEGQGCRMDDKVLVAHEEDDGWVSDHQAQAEREERDQHITTNRPADPTVCEGLLEHGGTMTTELPYVASATPQRDKGTP